MLTGISSPRMKTQRFRSFQISASLSRALNISPKLSGADRRQHVRRPGP